MTTLVLYHAGCWDGFCAAWLWSKYQPDAEFIPVQYGQEPPGVRGREVVILDFSYPRPVLERMHAQAVSLLVIDHHKTAAAELGGLDYCKFDMEKSGARLTCEWLADLYEAEKRFPPIPFRPSPWLVDYTEDRDLWRWALPNSRAVNAAIHSHELDFVLWDAFALRQASDYVREGEAILRREQQIVNDHVQHAVPVEMDGYRGRCVNATTLFSEIAGTLAEGHDFGAAYFIRKDGMKVWSLRSREGGCDVSAIAKARGGGGHRQAAGFQEAP